MNALSQLIYDLDLDEGMVLTRLKREGLIPYDCWDSDKVPEGKVQASVELVMRTLKEP